MKKSTIRIIITALVLITIGIGLFVGGVVAVGGIAAARAGLAHHGVYLDDGFYIDIHRGSNSVKHSDMEILEFDIQDVRKVEMELAASEVEIRNVDASEKHLSVSTNGKYEIYTKEGVLHIEKERGTEDDQLILEVPANMVFESVEISAGASVIQIDYLETKEFDAEIGAGEMIVNDLQADQTELEIGAGEVIIDYANVQTCEISVGMGNAEICLAGEEEDYNYEIDCAAGNIDIGNESFGGIASEKIINYHADADIKIECGMGNVTIGF